MLNGWKTVVLTAIAVPVVALAQVPAADEQVWEFDLNEWVKAEAPPTAQGDVYQFAARKGEWADLGITLPGVPGRVAVFDASGKLLGEASSSGQPDVELQFPADGDYWLRVETTSEYILIPRLVRAFDTTKRSDKLMMADAEFGPYAWLRTRTYERVDGTKLRWKWGEFNKSIVEEQLRDGKVVATHTITKGAKGHLLMDGKVDGVLGQRDGVVVGDYVEWYPHFSEGRRYGLSVQAADQRLRWETMAKGDTLAVDATEFLDHVGD